VFNFLIANENQIIVLLLSKIIFMDQLFQSGLGAVQYIFP